MTLEGPNMLSKTLWGSILVDLSDVLMIFDRLLLNFLLLLLLFVVVVVVAAFAACLKGRWKQGPFGSKGTGEAKRTSRL